jgi:hypothetical protein
MVGISHRFLVACLYVIGIGVAALLFVQHWVHIPQFLPFVVILACPLMHLFMHKGHGSHSHHRGSDEKDERRTLRP